MGTIQNFVARVAPSTVLAGERFAVNLSDIRWAKDWQLRAQITRLNKAERGAKSHPNGMSNMMLELIDRERGYIREEQQRRKTAAICRCPTKCDCENPEPPSDGVAHCSMECPVHNLTPQPARDCPVHGHP